MNYANFMPARGRARIDGGGSATIFSATSGGKWVCQTGMVGWQNAATSITVALYEIDATNSAVVFSFSTSATSGLQQVYFGEMGQLASVTNTRMILNTGAITGSVWGAFSGYYQGF